jgi:hypothetical protein
MDVAAAMSHYGLVVGEGEEDPRTDECAESGWLFNVRKMQFEVGDTAVFRLSVRDRVRTFDHVPSAPTSRSTIALLPSRRLVHDDLEGPDSGDPWTHAIVPGSGEAMSRSRQAHRSISGRPPSPFAGA